MIRTGKWESLEERSKESKGGIRYAVSGWEANWGKGTSLKKLRRSGDENSGSKSGLALSVFRFAEAEKDFGPIALWISVKPGSLSREDAQVAAVGCKKILDKFEITDVEVASEGCFSSGTALSSSSTSPPQMQPPAFPVLSTASQATLYAEGTWAIYFSECDFVSLYEHAFLLGFGRLGRSRTTIGWLCACAWETGIWRHHLSAGGGGELWTTSLSSETSTSSTTRASKTDLVANGLATIV